MSFSFSAGGTRDETLASLAAAALSDDGVRTRDLIVSFMEDAPDTQAGVRLRYQVQAYGHGSGGWPALMVSLSCQAPGQPAGGGA
jgi:hypothetical protein